ncbi:MAG: transposase [Anaerolineae bacterium]|nr:transposase [Anaerolineae bacterium]
MIALTQLSKFYLVYLLQGGSSAIYILSGYDRDIVGLIAYTFERQENGRPATWAGRGRGHPDRPRRETVEVRYQVTAVTHQEEAIVALHQTMGWRVYVTNAPTEELPLEQALLVYRDEWLIERGFHRLKGAPLSIDPLFVKRDDQIIGLTNLLSLGARPAPDRPVE